MRAIAVVDPFTYAVHALKSVLLKNAGFGAIGFDLLFLTRVRRGDHGRRHAALQAGAVMAMAAARLATDEASATSARETRPRASASCEAAMRLFSERGFHRVTVRDLCREARRQPGGGELPLRRTSSGSTGRSWSAALDRAAGRPDHDAPEGADAEERIRHYVRTYVPRLAAPDGRRGVAPEAHAPRDERAHAAGAVDRRGGDPAADPLPVQGDRGAARHRRPTTRAWAAASSASRRSASSSCRTTSGRSRSRASGTRAPRRSRRVEHIAEFTLAGIQRLATESAGS